MTLTLHRPFVLLVATRSRYNPNGKGAMLATCTYAVKLEVLVEGEVPTQRPATMTFTTQPNTPLVWRDSIDRYASYQNHYRGRCRRDQRAWKQSPKTVGPAALQGGQHSRRGKTAPRHDSSYAVLEVPGGECMSATQRHPTLGRTCLSSVYKGSGDYSLR